MWQGCWIQHLFIQAYFFVKTPKFSIVMQKSNGATKMFPEIAIPKLPETLSKVWIFLEIILQINEKINLPQMLSLTFKTLGTAQNNVQCCLVMFRFQSYSKHNSKHYDIFPILRHLHLSPTTFRKTKRKISQIIFTYI